MNRRAFLQVLAATAAGAVLDPELLLWVPGQKTIFLPPVVTPAAPIVFDSISIASTMFQLGDHIEIAGRIYTVTSTFRDVPRLQIQGEADEAAAILTYAHRGK